MTRVRKPAVAGSFYPASAKDLRALVVQYLEEARKSAREGAASAADRAPKAIIAPHAGLVCSGPIAASVYRMLEPMRDTITRVVLLGPSHRVPIRGIAVSDVEAFSTPLGPVAVDAEGVAKALDLPQVRRSEEAHEWEHCLEVQLPFLGEVLGTSFRIVPLVVGSATTEEIAQVIEALWGGPETLIVISSDLSHYHPYRTACVVDAETRRTIEALRPVLESEQACGCKAVNGLLDVARRRTMRCRTIDLRNSGDTIGSHEEVVGYGAFAFDERKDD